MLQFLRLLRMAVPLLWKARRLPWVEVTITGGVYVTKAEMVDEEWKAMQRSDDGS